MQTKNNKKKFIKQTQNKTLVLKKKQEPNGLKTKFPTKKNTTTKTNKFTTEANM